MNKIRNSAKALLLAIGVFGTSAVVSPAPASAATAVSFCFKFANPPTYSTYANLPVFIYQKLPHGWNLMSQGRTNSAGCGTFYNTPSNVSLAVYAYHRTQYQTWEGWSQYSAPPGSGTVHLGTGFAYRTR